MINLVVCDDSTLARKQLIRALPENWPVQLSQASDGAQALKLLRQGKGQAMLLDLTMPVLDGYQTLAAIEQEGLSCQVIVVSGDVQEEAINRALELGACAFIRKPADPALLQRTLVEQGLFSPQAQAAPAPAKAASVPALKVSLREALREVSNVAMGRAGALLAKVLDVFVKLPVPQVNLFEVSELHMTLQDAQRNAPLSLVCQGFIGEAIAGEALLMFHDTHIDDLAKLLGQQPALTLSRAELLLDLASLISGACIKSIGDQLDLRFSLGHPQLLGQHEALGQLIEINQNRWRKTLAIEISYRLEGHAVDFDLLLLFTEDSVSRLSAKLGHLME